MECSSAAVYFVSLLYLGVFSAAVHSASPTFDLPPLSGASETVAENTATGTSIYTLVITDSDGDLPTFSIASQEPATPEFTLVSNSIVQTPNEPLDAETSTSFTITFNVTDGVNTVTSPPFKVYVTDVNEFSPEFTSAVYTAVVRETDPSGSSVTTVTARDGDVTAEIFYSIQETQTPFNISKTTGDVTLVTPGALDDTITPFYNLTIQASDGTNTAVVTLTIYVKGDPCQPNPCQNSGHCTTSVSSYVCSCASGWVGDNCTTVDPCSPNPCENGGSCSISGSTFLCSCTSGWIGNNCSFPNQCHSDPCRNGGECSVTETGFAYECLCTAGWTGSNCSTASLCQPNPCKNGGECVISGNIQECLCTSGWIGSDCSTANPCHPDPCQNDGECLLFDSSYECLCTSGWTGSNCSTVHPCHPNPCKNGGKCFISGSTKECMCAAMWTGSYCSIANPCHQNPCQNAGVCVISGSNFECVCTSGWTGHNCSLEDQCFSNPCQHNGTCTRYGSSYACTCDVEWTGPNCELDNPCNPNPCQNNTRCFISGSSYLCNVTSGSEKARASSTRSDGIQVEIIIAVTASLVVIALVGLVLVGFSIHKRHKKKSYVLHSTRSIYLPVSPISLHKTNDEQKSSSKRRH